MLISDDLVVSASRVHRDQLDLAVEASGAVLQRPRHRRAIDQEWQDSREVDETPYALYSDEQLLIERWFHDITDRRIRRGVFKSVAQLVHAIHEYIEHHNANPRGFAWTAKAETILGKVRRARAALDNVTSGWRTTLG